MNIILVIVAVIMFGSYHFAVILYAADVFEYENKVFRFATVTMLINLVVASFAYVCFGTSNEYALIVFYMVVYGIEFKILSKNNDLLLFFGLTAFTINLFSRRMLTLAFFSYFTGKSMVECMSDPTLSLWIFLIPFSLATPYIVLTKMFLHRKYINMILSDKKNVSFSVAIMATVCAYIFSISFLTNATNTENSFLIIYILVGLICSMSYHVTLSFAFVFAKLKLHVTKYETLSKTIEDEEEQLKELELRSELDMFTGLKLRASAEKAIENHLKNNDEFHVIFFDIDGLKTVNDDFSHSEGDFYIKCVSAIVKDMFKTETVARLGGDEILVVGDGNDYYSTINKAVRTFEHVVSIAKNHNKPYQTSISYGIVNVSKDTHKTTRQIIDEADKKMYDFKRKNKKARR